MKKFILSAMMFVMAGTMNMFAQSQEYINAISELISLDPASNQMGKDDLKETFADILEREGIENSKAASLVEKYLSTQFDEDMNSIMAELYYQHMTLDQVKSLINIYKDPAMGDVLAKNAELSKNMKEATQQYLTNNIMNLMSGKELPAVELDGNVSSEYMELVKKNIEISNAKSMIDNAKNNIVPRFLEQIGDEEQKQMIINLFNTMFEALSNNFETLYANSAIGTITKQDLKNINAFQQTEEAKASHKVLASVTENMVEYGEKLIGKFTDWYEKQK
ncbi:MAG: DUF2059 domain-containing protein [Bacteroidaceae bacterium]|nr:DUF2059 domain-containing protein [Bacteroidaceae bacterium]